MVVHIDDLARVLRESGLPDHGLPPEEALAIRFHQISVPIYTTVTYDVAGRGTFMLDVTKDDEVVSIEWLFSGVPVPLHGEGADDK